MATLMTSRCLVTLVWIFMVIATQDTRFRTLYFVRYGADILSVIVRLFVFDVSSIILPLVLLVYPFIVCLCAKVLTVAIQISTIWIAGRCKPDSIMVIIASKMLQKALHT